MEDYKKIIENIKKTIDEKGVKHGHIASYLGFSHRKFSNILNYRTRLKLEDMVKIAAFLQVDINTFYKTED